MLFLYRPRQTWMPYHLPRNASDQAKYNHSLQQRFSATQRVARPSPAVAPAPAPPPAPAAPRDQVAALKELAALHAAGSLDDAEFSAAKARVLGTPGGGW